MSAAHDYTPDPVPARDEDDPARWTLVGHERAGRSLETGETAERQRVLAAIDARKTTSEFEMIVPESWRRVRLSDVLAGDHRPPEPTVLVRDDGMSLLYECAVNGIHGESGGGKSMLATVGMAQEINAGRHVIFLDFEDTAETISARLRALGVTDLAIETYLIYRAPSEPTTNAVVEMLVAEVKRKQLRLAVIDSVGEAFGVEGINEDRDNEVAPWLRMLPRALADAGAAVLLVDHGTKAADNALYPSGSKRKRAAIQGASYLVEVVSPLVRCDGPEPVSGRLRLTCAKDRHGTYRRGNAVAELEVTSYPDGGLSAHLWPVAARSADAQPLPVVLAAQKACKAAKDHGEPISSRGLIELMAVKARRDTKLAGIELAVSAGCLRVEAGPRGASLHSFVRDFEGTP